MPDENSGTLEQALGLPPATLDTPTTRAVEPSPRDALRLALAQKLWADRAERLKIKTVV